MSKRAMLVQVMAVLLVFTLDHASAQTSNAKPSSGPHWQIAPKAKGTGKTLP